MYYLKRDWQLYALMLLPMLFIIVFKYLAYTGLSVAFLDYKIGKGYAGSKFVGLEIFKKVFKHRDFTKGRCQHPAAQCAGFAVQLPDADYSGAAAQ